MSVVLDEWGADFMPQPAGLAGLLGLLALGVTVVLTVATAAMLLARSPVHRQRIGEGGVAAAVAWLVLAVLPLPRWLNLAEQTATPPPTRSELPAPTADPARPADFSPISRSPIAPDSNDTAAVPDGLLDARPLAPDLYAAPAVPSPSNAPFAVHPHIDPVRSPNGKSSDAAIIPASAGDVPPLATHNSADESVPSVTSLPIAPAAPISAPSTPPFDLAGWIVGAYAVGAAAAAIWLAVAVFLLHRAKQRATRTPVWIANLYDQVTGDEQPRPVLRACKTITYRNCHCLD